MSDVLDRQIVEMRFDNKQFESATATTMSTLDKLKQKLSFSGASKGLEEVNAAAKNVDMNGLGAGVDSVRAKFSALDVIGVTALANITNSAVNAGKRIISALTIDPIKTGFQEYETQINAVQTILANTSSKGTTIDDVNKALEELNAYADMTIYNFTEMTRNIGTFTAAGIDLDTSVSAIQGIANLAAVSGSTSQQASTAMYQLSQALAAGTVKLTDWNSVVNAGMGGEVFQNALKETSELLGTGAEAAIEAEGSFRESLTTGWLTAEVLTETLKKFTTSGANEYVAEYIGESPEVVAAALEEAEAMYGEADAIKYASQALAEKSGKNADEIADALQFAKTANDAATKVKTFTQLWDVLKESAQSGWSQSWKIIVGDFEEAKALLTPLSDFLTGVINKMSDWRNAILDNALAKGFFDLKDAVASMLDPLTTASDAIGTVVDTLVDYDKLVDEIIRGDWGNAPTRWQDLAAAGYDWAYAQNLVNERLGDSTRHATDYSEAQDQVTASTEDAATATRELTEADAKRLEELIALDDETLRGLGYTEEQIAALRELDGLAKKLGWSISDLIGNIDNLNGRWLIIESFKTIGNSLVKIFQSIGAAWKEIFHGEDDPIQKRSEQLFNLIAAFYRFSQQLAVNEDAAENFKRTFKGVFAALDIVLTLVGGPIKIAFKILGQLLSAFNLPILDITANIGDAIVKFRDWIDSVLDFTAIFEKLAPVVKNGIVAVKKWVNEHINLSNAFSGIKSVVVDTYESFKKWIDGLKEAEDLPRAIAEGTVNGFKNIPNFFAELWKALKSAFTGDWTFDTNGMFSGLFKGFKIAGGVFKELGKMALDGINNFLSARGMKTISLDAIQGLINGIKENASKVWNAMVDLGKQLIAKIKEVLGIHSPSTVFFAIGGFIIAGLIGGLLAGEGNLGDAVRGLGEKIGEFFGEVDFGTIFSAIISAGLLKALLDISGAVKGAGGMFEGLGEIFEGVGDIMYNAGKVVKKFGKVLGSISMSIKAKALKDIAIAILMLVGAVVILTFIDTKKLWGAIGAIAALAAIIGGLFVVLNKVGGNITDPKDLAKGAVNIAKIGVLLLAMGASILLIAAALKIIESIDPEKASQAFGGLTTVVLAMMAVMVVFTACTKTGDPTAISKLSSVLISMGVAMFLMAYVVKMMGKMDREQLIQGGVALAAFVAMMVGMIAMTKLVTTKDMTSLSSVLKGMGVCMLLMAVVVKLLGGMEVGELIKGGIMVVAFGGIIVGLIAATKLATDKELNYLSKLLTSMGVCMLLMAVVVKLLGGMDEVELIKGIACIVAFGGVITGLIAATKLATANELKGLAATLIAASIAIGVMGVVVALLGLLDPVQLAKGLGAVTILGLVVAAMIWATKGAQECKGDILMMAVAIGIMAVAVAALSFIEPSRLAGAVAAITTVGLMFAILVGVAGQAKGSLATLIVMTGAVTLLGGLIYLLAQLPVESTVGSALALSVLLLAVSGVMLILSKISVNIGNALLGVIGLTLMAIPMLAFVGVLALMQNVQNAQTNAFLLAALMTVMTALLIPLTIIGALWPAAFLGVAALTLMAIPMLAFVGVLALMQNVQNAQTNAELLIGLMTTMTGLLIALAIVAPLAILGVTAMAALTVLIVAIGALAVGIGALMEKFPQLEDFLNTGIPIMEKLAYAIGAMVGNLVAGFTNTVAASLPLLGQALSGFMIGAMPFINGIKMVDVSMLEGVATLTAAILLLTAADFINGIVSLLQGGSSLADLGAELSAFMINALPFIVGCKLITEESVAGVKSLADMILTLTKANVIEGLTSWFTGGSSLENFGAQLVPFGEQMAAFSEVVKGIDETAVVAAANAGKVMSEMAANLPNSGGVVGWFSGENDLSGFTEQLVPFGEAMASFSETVAGRIDEDAVTAAVNAGKMISEWSATLPNSGGVVAWFTGDNDLSAFSTGIIDFGEGIAAFSATVKGNVDEDAVTAAVNAGKIISEWAATLTNNGGVVSWFTGDNDLSTFSTKVVEFGNAMVDFSTTVKGNIDEEAVAAAVNTGKMMAGLADTLPESGGFASWFKADNDLSTFGKEIKEFGGYMKDYSDEVSGISISSMSSAITQAQRVADLAKDVSGINFSGLSDLGKSLGTLAKTGVDKFIEAFEDAESKVINAIEAMIKAGIDAIDGKVDDFKKAGKKAIEKFAEGIEDTISTAEKKAETMAEDAAEAADDNRSDWYDAGEYLVKGFASGITSNTWRAEARAREMAQAALDAAKSILRINSPSKATREFGRSYGLGFVNGIDEYVDKAASAGSNMAERAKTSLSNAISKVKMALDADIDTQPTIRPILDLSDVKTGVSALSGMMSGATVGLNANVGAVSVAMNRRSVSTTNDDVVSELIGIGKKLDNVGGDTYSVGNVNYTEGSDVAEALETIIRAAIIERRS